MKKSVTVIEDRQRGMGDGSHRSGRRQAQRGAVAAPPITVPFHLPSMDEREIHAAVTALREGSLGGGGRYGQQAESMLKAITSAEHLFFVTSCTHAMELALMALGVGRGDEVILPSFTFTSTATCIVRQGARPVFADIDPRSWTLDPDDVARRLSPRTRAIIPVHYAGHPVRFRELSDVLPRSCLVIEDAAHALGARYYGRAAGTLGHAGCFSFHITKNVTCGEGGALVLRDSDVAQRAEFMREKGTNRAQFLRGEVDRYSWVSEGSSFVASDLLAAVLVEQLKKMESILAQRCEIWQRYAAELAPLAARERLTLPVLEPGVRSSYHVFAVLVLSGERDRIREGLRARGIEATSHYVPLHTSPYWLKRCGRRQRPLPVTERVSRLILRLPLHPGLTPSQQDAVIEALYDLLDR